MACAKAYTPASSDSAQPELWDDCEPDAEESLGGNVEMHPPEHPTTLGHMVKSLMPGQDLTRVTIPSWFLESRSLLEKMADTMMHPQLLLSAADVEDPVDRLLAIVKWYISGWHYKVTGVKKPYNPIIGETFAAYWKHEDGSTSQYVAEQVLHRPPITAFYFENRQRHVVVNGQVHTRSRFSAPQTAQSILEGGATVHLTNHQEKYYITFPTFNAHNLLMGKLRTEVGGDAQVVCIGSDLSASFTFHQKPFWGGEDKIASVDIDVKRGKESLAKIRGHWNDKLYIKRGNAEETLFLDVAKEPIAPKYVLNPDKQGPWESRRLWRRTTDLLTQRPSVDWSAVDNTKGVLEEDQRLLACHKKEPEFKEWPTKLFTKTRSKNPVTDKEEDLYVFKYMKTEDQKDDEDSLNLIKLSHVAAMEDPRNSDAAQSAGLAGQKEANVDEAAEGVENMAVA